MALPILVNPAARGGLTGRRIGRLKERLASGGLEATIHVPSSREELRRLAVEFGRTPDDTVGLVGGDGTNMAVVDALIQHHGDGPLPSIALIPGGRGNSFSKDFSFTSLDQAIATVKRGRTREVDVGRFTADGVTGHFLNCVGMGFVTDVNHTASHFRLLGDVGYIIGVLHRTIALRNHHFRIEIDGRVVDDSPMCFVEVMNSKNTAGDMIMAPDAEFDDGEFDVVWVTPITRRQLLRTFPKIFSGTHGSHPSVHFARGKRITITAGETQELLPDGDHIGTTPVTIEVLPRRVRYLC